MNLVDVGASHTRPDDLVLTPQGKVRLHPRAKPSGFFMSGFQATAMDAIDNGPASANFHGKTGGFPHQKRQPHSVYASDCITEPAGDKMAGMNRILQGSLVQQHGAGSSSISPLDNCFRKD